MKPSEDLQKWFRIKIVFLSNKIQLLMFIYNVTISLDPAIEKEWLTWMKSKHIKDVLATGCFLECKLSRVHGEEENGVTFSMMYLAENEAKFQEYQSRFATTLQSEHTALFNGKFAAFRTTLTVLEHIIHASKA